MEVLKVWINYPVLSSYIELFNKGLLMFRETVNIVERDHLNT